MATKIGAIVDVILYFNVWPKGAAAVTDGDGEYVAVPGAFLAGDILYTGPRKVVFRLPNLAEMVKSLVTAHKAWGE